MKKTLTSTFLFLVLSLSAYADQEDYPYLSLICSNSDYTGKFLVQFGDETLPNGKILQAGVHVIEKGIRYLADKAVKETKGLFGEYETDKLILESGGSAEWFVDLSNNDKVYLNSSRANFRDAALLNCVSYQITK